MSFFDFGKYRLVIIDDLSNGTTKCALVEDRGEDRAAVFLWNNTFKTLEQGEDAPPEAFLRVSQSMLQGMMDSLWGKGYRPKYRRFDTEMTLVKAHLEDMRKLVFKESQP